jgi:hypothetical protein
MVHQVRDRTGIIAIPDGWMMISRKAPLWSVVLALAVKAAWAASRPTTSG